MNRLLLFFFGSLLLLVNKPEAYGEATFNPDLISYRLEAKNLSFEIAQSFQGEPFAVRMKLGNAGAQETVATLRLNAERMEPFFPFIPPYIGLGARKFTARLWIGSLQGVKKLHFVFDRTNVDFQIIRVDLGTLKANQWNAVELDDPKLGSVAQPLTGVRVEATLTPGARGDVFLADPVLTTDTGKTYALLNTGMPLMMTGMTTPLAKGPARGLPQRDSLTLGGYDIQNDGWYADLPDMAKFMNQHFPDADFVIAPVWTPYPILAERLVHLPPGVFFQFQKAQLDTAYLSATKEIPTNSAGKEIPSFGNGIIASNPVVQTALKDQIDYAASLGVNNFKQVDYVWTYDGGLWGYDPASVAAERDDVTGRDEGLNLLQGPGGQPPGLIHFWDYFEQNHGVRLDPSEVGIESWDEYDPALEKTTKNLLQLRKLGGIHIALIHYEWLRQSQRFGRWAKAVGGQHDYTLNGENWLNGGDYIYLMRLVDAGTPYCEYFGGPANMRWNFNSARMYTHAADIANKRLGLITEIGEGGHGENYLAPEVGYLYAYEIAAMGFRDYHNEWAEGSFHEMNDPKNAYLYDRFSSWMTQAFGFRQARRENVTRPDVRVLGLTIRSSVYGYVNGDQSFSTPLSDAHVNFEQTDLMSSSDSLEKADVLFYAPDCSPARMTDQLQKWLDQGNKTLVTHSFIPLALDYGQAEPTQDTARRAPGFPSFSLLPEFKDLHVETSGAWDLPGSNVLLDTIGKPLLSQISLPNGSQILYVNNPLLSLSKADTSRVMAKLIDLLHLPQIVVEKPELGDSVMAEIFQHGRTQVLSLWNRSCLNKHGFFGGYGPHLLVGRGADQFDPKVRPYPYFEPGAKCGAGVPVATAGPYRVYRFFADKEETVNVGADHLLPLTVEGTAMEQFYFAPDGDAIRQEVAALHQHRAEVAPYFVDIPATVAK